MKKAMATLAMIVLSIGLSACGTAGQSEEQTAQTTVVQLANPIKEVTVEELVTLTGIRLSASEGAEGVSYQTITLDENTVIAQMRFTMEDVEAFVRAQATAELEASDISGLYYEWTKTSTAQVDYCEAIVYLKDDVGYIAWLDVAPGVVYNLGVTEGATAEVLTMLANAVFEPLQDER